jgi:hypothetical protein
MADEAARTTVAAAPGEPPLSFPPRTLQNAAGLLLVGGCLSAFASAQFLIGGPFFYTLLPDGSATDSTLDDGSPAPGAEIIPREVVLAWAAVGVALLLGAVFAFVAYRRARAGKVRPAFGWAVAASLLAPVNPVTVAGAVLAWRARRPGPVLAPPAARAPGRSGLLRVGAWVLLAGALVSAMVAVGSIIEAVLFAIGSQTVDVPAFAAAQMLGTTAFLLVTGAAGAGLGLLAFWKARQGHASAAGGWGLAAGILPFNPLLLLGAALCLGSPERQSAAPASGLPTQP